MNPDWTFDFAQAPERNSKHWSQNTITWDEIIHMVTTKIGEQKESGNYLLGVLKETAACAACRKKGLQTCRTRTNRSVVHRGALMLDADTPTASFLEDVDLALLGTAYIIHTTFSSAPDQPRYRLIVPTDRTMDPETFGAASRAMMQRIGIESFDRGSDEPARYMFRPAAQHKAWYWQQVQDGQPLRVDDLLKNFDDDLSSTPFPRPHQNKRDPYTLEGVIGDFNKAYQDDLQGLIAQYELPYVSAGADRWQLVGSAAQAGMGEIEPGLGLYFSYHANDPAFRQTCSAFDLVRIHRFNELDANCPNGTPVNRLPSHEAMLELASQDPRVLHDQFEELDDEDKWQFDLDKTTKGIIRDTPHNRTLIHDNDPLLRTLRYNEITFSVEATEPLPWRPDLEATGGPVITDTDYFRIWQYLWERYVKLPKDDARQITESSAKDRWYNPIKEYLNGLQWDGQRRLEECLPAEPTDYVRLVARKSLVAAVARALDPGCKWDHTLVLVGPEGMGKTFWVENMSKGWFGQLGRLDDKDTLLVMQRSWIMTSDEAHTLRRAESEQQKEFLTRTEDVFRLPYERTTRGHPRRCVVWGTTNDEIFLRQQEGNRRFLIVRCGRLDFGRFTDEYIDQVWAEAVALYRAGERLYLTDEESSLVLSRTAEHVEEDTLPGLVMAYLDDDEDDVRDETCTWELWEYALGNYNQKPKPGDLRDLFVLMKKLPGWELQPRKRQMGKYGAQRWFARTDNKEDSGSDIL